MGLDAWFFARMDGADKDQRRAPKALEWIWQPNKDDLGDDINIFTHMLLDHYYGPLDFDTLGNDAFWIDPDVPFNNAEFQAQRMLQCLDDRVNQYRSNEIFVVLGGDFRYMNAF